MKLKTRLIISFCIIIFVPVFLAGIVFLGFKNFQMKNLEQTYGLEETSDYNYLTNSLQLLNRFTKKDFEEIIGGLLIKPQGKPTLVPVTDKRQPMNVADVKNDFKMED